MKSGQGMLVTIFQTPFYWLAFLAGVIVEAVVYGYFVGSTYWDEQ